MSPATQIDKFISNHAIIPLKEIKRYNDNDGNGLIFLHNALYQVRQHPIML